MDQSKSNNTPNAEPNSPSQSVRAKQEAIPLPPRTFTLEFFVGLFTMVSVAAIGWLAIGLGKVEIFTGTRHDVLAEFDNISGLGKGASIEIGGVPIGIVSAINLDSKTQSKPMVTLHIDGDTCIREEDSLAIRTKGIIGDRYIKITRGASNTCYPDNKVITDTNSVIDIEDLIGKLVHNFSGDKSSDEGNDKKK